MPWDEYRLRQWLRQEQRLLRELSLMLAVALVVGVYFLERVHTLLEHNQRQTAEALAEQLAGTAEEFVVTGNLVSLNVIGAQTAALEPVARVEFRNAAGVVMASAGENATGRAPVSTAVRLDDQSIVGTVELWPARLVLRQEETLETTFVLVVLCLLLLRILAEMVWRRLQATPAEEDEEDLVPVLAMSQTSEAPRASLRISIVNFDRMRDRLTPTLIEEMLAGYAALLSGIAQVYGAKTIRQLGDQCALELRADSRAEAVFQALCAGMLFRQTARRLSEQRKSRGRTPLEFKLLVTASANMEESWAMCVAGLPGRVHVPEAELEKMELDARLLYQSDRCLSISSSDVTLRIQPVEQLAQRYQKLIADQAERLLRTDGGGPSPSK